MNKKVEGITLIALVITIIILLILAGISIAMLTGENGILTKAIQAKEETEKAQYKELVEIIIMEKQVDKAQNLNEERTFIEVVAEAIQEKSWAKSVETCDDKEDYSIAPEYKNKIIVNTTDGYEIIVNIDNELREGEVISITKGKGKKWTITFHENKGSGTPPEAIERREGWSLELPKGENLNKVGYKLVGWSENPNENPKGDQFYKPGEIYYPTENTTLYAIWDNHTVELTFHSNTGESSSTNRIHVGYNVNTKLPANTLKNNGWNFKEWNTNPEGTGIKYADTANIQITEDTTLYAIWDEIVTATLSVTNNKFTEGSQISLGGTAPSGIQKVELKVGNNVLYSNSNISDTSYKLSNADLLDSNKINQTALANLDFYKINVVLAITSKNGKTGNQTLEIENYTIGNANSLNKFAQVVNAGNSLSNELVILISDIPSITNYAPIGYYNGTDILKSNCFSGIFDGKGKYINIQGWTDKQSAYSSRGCFGAVTYGEIRNLTVKGIAPTGNVFGGVVGFIYSGKITNCKNESTSTSATGWCRGGVCGCAISSNIFCCSNVATVRGTSQVGGIVGSIYTEPMPPAQINSCYNKGSVTATNEEGMVGGLAGIFLKDSVSMINSYCIASVSGINSVGGFVGMMEKRITNAYISNCYYVGTITAEKRSFLWRSYLQFNDG